MGSDYINNLDINPKMDYGDQYTHTIICTTQEIHSDG